MQKWEYCGIGPIKTEGIGGWKGSYPQLDFFKSNGLDEKRIKRSGDLAEEGVLAAKIASLGEEGWEMVGCGTVGVGHYLYFKRPKQ